MVRKNLKDAGFIVSIALPLALSLLIPDSGHARTINYKQNGMPEPISPVVRHIGSSVDKLFLEISTTADRSFSYIRDPANRGTVLIGIGILVVFFATCVVLRKLHILEQQCGIVSPDSDECSR